MQFETALSTAPEPEAAVDEVAAALRPRFGARGIELVLAFAAYPPQRLDELPRRLLGALGGRRLAGCSAGGLIGAGREIEQQAGLAVTAVDLDGSELEVTRVGERELPDPDAPPAAWRTVGRLDPAATRGIGVLADPFTADVDHLLSGLDYAYASAPKFGGLASGGPAPGANRLFVDDSVARSGSVLFALGHGLRVQPVVAQGCTPIGRVGRITAAEGSQLHSIDGEPAIRYVERQIRRLDDAARRAATRSPLFLGIEIDPFRLDQPEAGEFLVRHLMGFDQQTGAMAVGADLAVGRRVQLHLRDRDTSAADLRSRLAGTSAEPPPFGALLFSCLGRGQHLYGAPGHDSAVFHELCGDVPLAGFFCGGEIGPVGGASHLHGYTSVFALLHEEPA